MEAGPKSNNTDDTKNMFDNAHYNIHKLHNDAATKWLSCPYHQILTCLNRHHGIGWDKPM